MSEPFWDFPFAGNGPDAQPPFGGANTSPADLFKINGIYLPGPAIVKAKRRAKTQKKKQPGVNGETATHLGYDAAEIRVTFRMWTQQQWDAWQALIPVLQPKPGKDVVTTTTTPTNFSNPAGQALLVGAVNIGDANLVAPQTTTTVQKAGPQPLTVYHPFLAAYGIKQLWCEEIGIPEATGQPQVFAVQIVFREFLRTGGAVSTKTKASLAITDVGINQAFKGPPAPNYVPDKVPQPPSQTSTGPNTNPLSFTPSLF